MRLLSRFRLRTKLLLVILLPLAGMATFAGLWAARAREEAADAGRERERTELMIHAAAVAWDTRLDGLLTALTEIAPRTAQVFGPIIGVLQANADKTRDDLARHLDALMAHEGRVRSLSGDGGEAWERAHEALGGLPGARTELTRLGRLPDPDVAAREIDAAVSQFRAAAEEMEAVLFALAGSGPAAADASALAGLADLEGDTAEEERVLLQEVERGEASRAGGVQLLELQAREDATVQATLPLLPAAIRSGLEEWLGSGPQRRWQEVRAIMLGRTGLGPRVPGDIGALPTALVAQSRTLALDGLRADLGELLTARARAAEDDAYRSFVLALAVAAAVIALTVALAILVVRSITSRLGRLESAARSVGGGDLDAQPLALTGGDEVAVLGAAFDEMTASLGAMEAQADALADGRTDDPSLRRDVPGRMGTLLRRSVSNLSAVTARLRASEALARAIVDTAAEAIWTVGADGVVLSANDAAGALLARRTEEMVGRPQGEILPALVAGRDGDLTNHEAVVERADGLPVPVLLSTRRVHDGHGDGITTVFARDISERKELERRLAHQATHDPLTGLPNRASILARIERAVAATRREGGSGFGLLFVDLDHFKDVNDALGHPAGDALLTEVARRLESRVRPGDSVARLGGDEFVVLAEECDTAQDALQLAWRLIDAVQEPVTPGGERPVRVTASIGVAWADGEAGDAASLLREADLAMYRAKEAGRSRALPAARA